jgi:hypothetical protein
MNADYTIGRINFGPRDSFTTLGQLIDEIAAQEELVDDLCLFAGDLLTEIEWLRAQLPPPAFFNPEQPIYEL